MPKILPAIHTPHTPSPSTPQKAGKSQPPATPPAKGDSIATAAKPADPAKSGTYSDADLQAAQAKSDADIARRNKRADKLDNLADGLSDTNDMLHDLSDATHGGDILNLVDSVAGGGRQGLYALGGATVLAGGAFAYSKLAGSHAEPAPAAGEPAAQPEIPISQQAPAFFDAYGTGASSTNRVA